MSPWQVGLLVCVFCVRFRQKDDQERDSNYRLREGVIEECIRKMCRREIHVGMTFELERVSPGQRSVLVLDS